MSDAHSSASKKVSNSAISRVLALQAAELNAARMMVAESYPDFFADYGDKGGGGSWHEGFQDVITPFGEFPDFFSPSRMMAIDALHLGQGEGYADFFVEGGGGNWHESVAPVDADGEDHQLLIKSQNARATALSKSNVLRAYATLKAGGFAKE
jgi:hypothetical protein